MALSNGSGSVWAAALLTCIWLVVLALSVKQHGNRVRHIGRVVMLWTWPLLLCSELWVLFGGEGHALLSLLSLIVNPVSLFGMQWFCMTLIWRKPHFARWPHAAVSVLLIGLCIYQVWRYAGRMSDWQGMVPYGDPLTYWPVYASCVVLGFFMLYTAIVQVEHIQQYHHELPLQVVDVAQHKLKGVAGALGFMVGVAFCLVAITVLVATGILPFASWISWFHIGVAASSLAVLSQLIRPINTSPSPFEHHVLHDTPALSPSKASAIVKHADAMVIASKAYKQVGLTLEDFSSQAKLDPTQLCLALLTVKKQHFRNYIYQFRMKYAKQLLLHSDIKLDQVAKRLQLGSKGTVSHAFLKYLEKK